MAIHEVDTVREVDKLARAMQKEEKEEEKKNSYGRSRIKNAGRRTIQDNESSDDSSDGGPPPLISRSGNSKKKGKGKGNATIANVAPAPFSNTYADSSDDDDFGDDSKVPPLVNRKHSDSEESEDDSDSDSMPDLIQRAQNDDTSESSSSSSGKNKSNAQKGRNIKSNAQKVEVKQYDDDDDSSLSIPPLVQGGNDDSSSSDSSDDSSDLERNNLIRGNRRAATEKVKKKQLQQPPSAKLSPFQTKPISSSIGTATTAAAAADHGTSGKNKKKRKKKKKKRQGGNDDDELDVETNDNSTKMTPEDYGEVAKRLCFYINQKLGISSDLKIPDVYHGLKYSTVADLITDLFDKEKEIWTFLEQKYTTKILETLVEVKEEQTNAAIRVLQGAANYIVKACCDKRRKDDLLSFFKLEGVIGKQGGSVVKTEIYAQTLVEVFKSLPRERGSQYNNALVKVILKNCKVLVESKEDVGEVLNEAGDRIGKERCVVYISKFVS